ncbi:hypothetical protein [Thermomonas sp.]|uniref:hypothetical protein n=1 Tax=Thermomonas sp. TaxID=1971895 RepID=UPI002638AAF8|nr:hypothetical protein [Thermomonas sp.]
MVKPRGQYRAGHKPPRQEAAARYAECLRRLYSTVQPTREELARIEREAQAAPYRNRQGELPV